MEKEKWTYEDILAEARRLWRSADEATARLFCFLYRIRHTEEMLRVVEEAGLDFEGFVRRSLKHVSLDRYQRFEEGFEQIGCDEDLAVQLGAEAVMAARRLTAPDRLPVYIDAVTAWVEEHGGCKPSRETAAGLVHQVDPRAQVPQAVRHRTRLQELESENAKLRAEVKSLRAENAALKAEIERMVEGKPPKRRRKGGARKVAPKSSDLQTV